MYLNELRKFALALRVPLVYQDANDVLNCIFGIPFENPILQDAELRSKLQARSDAQDFPALLWDDHDMYFACISADDGHYYLGPMASSRQSAPAIRLFYRTHGIDVDDAPFLRTFSVQEILYITELAAQMLTGRVFEETELLLKNDISGKHPENAQADRAAFRLNEEYEDDTEENWRHSYRVERALYDAIKDGDVRKALELNRLMDNDAGQLASDPVDHWRNRAIVGITVAARAAIDGGLSPRVAYRISGYYIRKTEGCSRSLDHIGLRDLAVRDLVERVRQKREAHSGSYINNAKAYIRQHYREKIYLKQIADSLGISPSYLSRLFKNGTGTDLQHYITGVRTERAAELLRYSEMSLSEIAAYVNFPSAGYFGKCFRERFEMTPKQYRTRYYVGETEDIAPDPPRG